METACSPVGAVSGILLSVALIVILLRFRVDLGLSLFAGAILIGLCSGLGIGGALTTVALSCVKVTTLRVLAVIVLIMVLAEVASHHGYLEVFTRALQRLISDRRVNMCLIPAFGGLLPMPGGAMWSAPLVGTVSDAPDITPEHRTFVNYWFRHVWEYVLPIYPALVLAAAILPIPIAKIVIAQAPLCAAAIVSGAVVVFMRIGRGDGQAVKDRSVPRELLGLLSGIWPFAFVILLVLVFKADLLAVVVVTIVIIALIQRTGLRTLGGLARRAFSLSTISLVLGVMAFKEVMEVGGVVRVFPGLLGALNVPDAAVLFLVPMLVGLLTGIAQAFVGVAFPVVLPFALASASPVSAVAIAYAGGFLGVLLSPVHLCLILTHHYFGAKLGGVYRLMIFPTIAVALVAFAVGLR
jgi:integral membrane protein (TIGR00529 family)